MCIFPEAVYTHNPLYYCVPTLRARDIRLAVNSPREAERQTKVLLFPHGAARDARMVRWVKETDLIFDLRSIDRAVCFDAGTSSDLVSLLLLPRMEYSF